MKLGAGCHNNCKAFSFDPGRMVQLVTGHKYVPSSSHEGTLANDFVDRIAYKATEFNDESEEELLKELFSHFNVSP